MNIDNDITECTGDNSPAPLNASGCLIEGVVGRLMTMLVGCVTCDDEVVTTVDVGITLSTFLVLVVATASVVVAVDDGKLDGVANKNKPLITEPYNNYITCDFEYRLTI